LPHNVSVNFEYKTLSPYRIFIWQDGTGTGFSYNTPVLPCQYNFINTPYSYFIHLKWRSIICFKQHYMADICMSNSVFFVRWESRWHRWTVLPLCCCAETSPLINLRHRKKFSSLFIGDNILTVDADCVENSLLKTETVFLSEDISYNVEDNSWASVIHTGVSGRPNSNSVTAFQIACSVVSVPIHA